MWNWGIYEVERWPWILKFDGSSMEKSIGAGIVIISPKGINTTLSFNLAFKCTNNQAEYEVLVIGLDLDGTWSIRGTHYWGLSISTSAANRGI